MKNNNDPPISAGCLKPFLVVTCLLEIPINFIMGSITGQSAGMLPQLMKGDSLIQITREEATWIASISEIGTLFASCMAGTLSDEFGRIRACQVSYFFASIGFGVMMTAESFKMLLLSRLFIGLGVGFYFPSFVYVSESTPPEYRSLFLSLGTLSASVGLVYIYVVGGYLPWNIAAAITCLLSIVGLCLTFLCYDSPPWLVRKNKIDEARKSLQRLEHPLNVEATLKELQDIAAHKIEEEPFSIKTFTQPIVFKPFFMILTLSVFQNGSGFYIIIYYTVNFMEEFHSTFDPLQAMIAVGIVRLISMAMSSYLLGRIGRKTIGAVSGISSGLILLLIFAALNFENYFSKNSRIPVCLFLIFILTMSFGIFPLPWLMPYEVFPMQVRGVMCGISFCFMFVIIFVTVKLYNVLVDGLGLKGLILMFATSSMAFGIFSITLLVETHNKTLEEIERKFLSKKEKKVFIL